MSLPDRTGPHDGQVPDDDKAIGVAGQESLVLPAKHSRMDLCLVPSQNGLGLRRAAVGCHCVQKVGIWIRSQGLAKCRRVGNGLGNGPGVGAPVDHTEIADRKFRGGCSRAWRGWKLVSRNDWALGPISE